MTRETLFKSLFPHEPAFRWKQIEKALFEPALTSADQITTLSKPMREILQKEFPWMSCQAVTLRTNPKGDTTKAVLQLQDGEKIESVLMQNARGELTICISSQVGCAMGCLFCATGKMGLKRNLDSDEIIDQYRFWQTPRTKRSEVRSPSPHPPSEAKCAPQTRSEPLGERSVASRISSPRISNIVVMGMGEPFANYENMKKALNTLLTQTDLGPTRITVSTVGLIPMLNQMLNDKDWPHIRLAISLHSAIPETRKNLIPTSNNTFLEDLTQWGKNYLKKLGNRRHHLTFEYVFLKNVNDAPKDAKALITLVHALGPENVRVNLIPYNFTGTGLSQNKRTKGWVVDDERIACAPGAPDEDVAKLRRGKAQGRKPRGAIGYAHHSLGDFVTSPIFQSGDNASILHFQAELEKHGVTVTIRRSKGDDIEAACGQLIVLNNKN